MYEKISLVVGPLQNVSNQTDRWRRSKIAEGLLYRLRAALPAVVRIQVLSASSTISGHSPIGCG